MKASVIREMSTEDIVDRVKEEKASLNKMTLSHAVSPIENPMLIRSKRRTIARMLTELKSRELANISNN